MRRARRLPVLAVAAWTAACGGGAVNPSEALLPPLPEFEASCSSAGPELLAPSASPDPAQILGRLPRVPEEWLLRRRFVTVNTAVLPALGGPARGVRLNLFDDVCFDASLMRIQPSGPPTVLTWAGSIQGGEPYSTVFLSSSGPSLVGSVRTRGAYPRSYRIESAGGPVHEVYETDERRIPPG